MTATLAATVAAAVLALPLLAAVGYLVLLTVFSMGRRRRPLLVAPQLKFCIVVPAHDEEAGIERTIRNLLTLDYPVPSKRLLVVADNCGDGTAAVAAAAGAEVLVRNDAVLRGKGYALAMAFEHCLAQGWADVVVVVDADTIAKPNLLSALNEHFAGGPPVLQVRYGVLEDRRAWRARLSKLSFALFHDVRSMARERLGLSCGLRGNGMAFELDVLRRVPHRAFSVVEDLEYGLDLGAAGVRIGYVATTEVLGEMPAGEAAARTQRRRWEGGRAQLRRRIPELLALAWRKRDWMPADLAIDLAIPPLTILVVWAALGTIGVVAAVVAGLVRVEGLTPWVLSDLGLTLYVLRGWYASGVGLRGLLDLAWAPVFILWKLGRVGLGARPTEWVRTARAAPVDPQIPR